MTACTPFDRADKCPTKPEIHAQLLANLPRGRAWQSEQDLTPESDSDLARYWSAFASVLEYVNTRICDALAEFSCGTMSETRDLWEADYGIPDDCGLWTEVCDKVAAIGGTRCEYFAEIAARAGWTIECRNLRAEGPRLDCMTMDCAQFVETSPALLDILVLLDESPAWSGVAWPIADCGQMDCMRFCEPDPDPLRCVLERIVPAHLDITYEVA
jgi:uncharacterized protein YmfQ (DUF2313 family)